MTKIRKLITSIVFFFMGSHFMISPLVVIEASAQTKRKKVIYKKYTELNFSGETVQGKARTPELFYIFQRKRSEGHKLLTAPQSFKHRTPATAQTVKGALNP